MTTMLEQSQRRRTTNPAERLRATMAAARISLSWLGVHKSLSPQQKAEAADTFGANDQFISAGKKLLDTKHPSFRSVTAVRNRIISLWKGMSLPYPEPAVRLIRLDQVELFNEQMVGLRAELGEAVERLEEHYADLKAAARNRLGRLFNDADYPPTLGNLFSVEWDFPSIEPPAYLQQVNPELYEQESQRVAARFDEALELAEQAFASELSQLVSHLHERLSGAADGKAKVFRDSAVTNLVEFFQKFRNLNVRSNDQLDELVSHAQQVVQGIEPQSLRDNRVLRQTLVSELSELQGTLEGLLVDRPRRNILRQSPAQETA